MDFFDHQDQARRRTGLLLAYLVLAVALIVLAVYAVVWGLFSAAQSRTRTSARGHSAWDEEVAPRPAGRAAFVQPDLFAGVAGVTLAVIAAGTLYRIVQLRGGGATVARMLGGTLITRQTQDFHERQLLNVVEEMAIAAGTAVPPVYRLDSEDAINAFAAGFTPADAVIGVTRGCLLRLSRDELQGVIAHEFSHILNGDMRLNLRLMGILHGILLIALIGYGIVRGTLRSGMRSGRRGKEAGGKVVALLLGVALVIIGYVGVFFAKLIQSAVSRQREFLADASAVQFTRNPDGIAGALKKIAALARGSRLDEPQAAEASHLFFGNALASSWFGWLATHPPVLDRIRRIQPSFDGRLPTPESLLAGASPTGVSYQQARASARAAAGPPRHLALQPASLVAQVGAPTADHLALAVQLREGLPAELLTAIQAPSGSQAVLCGLLLSRSEWVRQGQRALLQSALRLEARQALDAVLPGVDALAPSRRMPLLELAIPALKELPAPDLRAFTETVRRLVDADQEVDLFEYTLQGVLRSRIRGWLEPEAGARVDHTSLTPLRAECRLLLSTLARMGAGEVPAERAFNAAAAALGTVSALGLAPEGECTLTAVDAALGRLAHLAYPIRGRVLSACTEVVLADRKVAVEEAELLRAIAAALDCPMPPLLATEEA